MNPLKECKTARPNVHEVKLKVIEFTDFDNQRVFVAVQVGFSPTMCGVV